MSYKMLLGLLGMMLVIWLMGFGGGVIYKTSLRPVPAKPPIIAKESYVKKPTPVVVPKLDTVVNYIMDESVLDKATARKLVELTFLLSKRPLLLLAFFQKESSFNPFATGKIGEAGLGQIRPKLHFKDLHDHVNLPLKRDLYDMEWNIKCTEYLITKWLAESGGDVFKLANRYNGGGNGMKYAKPLITFYFKLKDIYDAGQTNDQKMDGMEKRKKSRTRIGR